MANEITLISRETREASPKARFLSGEEQKRYDNEIKKYRGKAREVLSVPLEGSNLFKVLLLNQIGIRTATLPELECALENGMDLRRSFEDASSVILRSAGDSYSPNDSIAKGLAKKLKLKNFKTPKIIDGLRIIESEDSDYRLNFDTKDAQIIEASDFDSKNHGRRFSRINSDYSIDFDEKATRTFYARDNGVSRLYLDRCFDLLSWGGNLAGSNDDGRVVVVSGEAT